MRTGISFLAVTLVALAAAAAPARAACDDASAWLVGRGELLAEPGCAWVLTTDAENHDESLGDARLKEPVTLPYELDLRLQRLDPGGGRTLWLTLVGGDVLIKSGSIAWYGTPEQFRRDGYVRLPELSSHMAHRFTVRQTAAAVELRIDGKPAARFAFRAGKRRGRIGIGFNGARGYRAAVRFSDVTVRSGSGAQ